MEKLNVIGKEDFVAEVQKLVDAVDREADFEDAVRRCFGCEALKADVLGTSAVAMTHLVGRWCPDLPTARQEAEWFVFETDFGRNTLKTAEGESPYHIYINLEGNGTEVFPIRSAGDFHDYLEFHYRGVRPEREGE